MAPSAATVRQADTATLLAATLVVAALVAFASSAHAGLYKWTDERGVVHYSDKMPADAVNRASVQLNRAGIAVRRTEQARPVAPRAPATESDELRSRQAERDRMLATRRDRAIVESYTSEAEIDLAKSRAVATIDGQINSAQAFVTQMQKRREELTSKMATYSPRPVPGALQYELETLDGEVARQNDFVAAKKKEAAGVAARYDSDKQRFRELRNAEPSGAVVTSEGRFSTAPVASLQLTSGPAPQR
jgi:hypothetical protein